MAHFQNKEVDDLEAKKSKNDKLDYKFFFAETGAATAQPETDRATVEAIVSTAGGLALFIPEVGPGIWGAASVVTMFLQLQDIKDRSQTAKGAHSDVEKLELAMAEYFKNQNVKDSGSFVRTLKEQIQEWVTAGAFNYNEITHEDKMNSIKTTLSKYVDTVGESTFRTLLDKLKNGFEWRDNECQTMMLALITMCGTCMELLCIIDANLAHAYQVVGKTAERDKWKTAFRDNLKAIRVYFEHQLAELNKFMEAKKTERRGKLDSKVGSRQDIKTEPGEYDENGGQSMGSTEITQYYFFKDNYSGKTWEAGYMWGETIFKEDHKDKFAEIERKMEELRKWYAGQLDKHIEAQFEVMSQVKGKWSKFAEELSKVNPKVGEESLDGKKLYEQMLGRTVA